MREPGNSKDKVEVGGTNEQDTKEMEVAAAGKEVTQLVTVPTRTLSLTTAL